MPNNWKTYKLSEINSIQIIDGDRGKNYPSKNEFFENGYCLFLSAKNITKTGFEFSELSFISEEKDSLLRKGKLETNDIILTTRGTIGNVGYYKENFVYKNVRINSGMVVIRVDEAKISSSYVYQLFKSSVFQEQISSRTSGSAQPQLPIRDLSLIEINLPENLQEQQSIASILSAIDDKIKNNLAINKTLEEMAMALYKHWFVDFGPFQNGEFIESELGLIPKDWEVKRLDEIITVKRGGSPRPIQDFLASEGLPWVKISDATASNSPYLMETKEFIREEGLKKTVLLKKGSLILSNSASPGIPKFLELDACIHDGWLHFPEINRFGKYLLFLTFLRIKEELIQKGNGSVFTNLKTDILKSQLVTLPPNDIEIKINIEIKSYFKQIKSNSIENQTLIKLRDTLLPQLISGEVRLKEFREKVV